jgi:hypothetical protein
VAVTDANIAGQAMRRVQVNVTQPNGETVTMTGYRGNY